MWMESLLFHTLPSAVGNFLHNYTMPAVGMSRCCFWTALMYISNYGNKFVLFISEDEYKITSRFMCMNGPDSVCR